MRSQKLVKVTPTPSLKIDPNSKSTSHNLGDALPLNDTLLLIVPRNAPIDVRKVTALHGTQELLIVSDDDKLEVLLVATHSDDLRQAHGKRTDVFLIEIRGRLVQRDQTTVDAKTLSQ
jgi:hypothetical protein